MLGIGAGRISSGRPVAASRAGLFYRDRPELGKETATCCANSVYQRRNKIADGYHGWPEVALFDAIVVTAAASHIPPALLQQLKPAAGWSSDQRPVARSLAMLIENNQAAGSPRVSSSRWRSFRSPALERRPGDALASGGRLGRHSRSSAVDAALLDRELASASPP